MRIDSGIDVNRVSMGGMMVGGGIAILAGLVCLSLLSIMAKQWMQRALYESGTVPYLYKRQVIAVVKQAAMITGCITAGGLLIAAISGGARFAANRRPDGGSSFAARQAFNRL